MSDIKRTMAGTKTILPLISSTRMMTYGEWLKGGCKERVALKTHNNLFEVTYPHPVEKYDAYCGGDNGGFGYTYQVHCNTPLYIMGV